MNQNIININPSIIVESVSETELMLYNNETEEIHLLNETATKMFNLLQEMSQECAIKAFLNEYVDSMINDKDNISFDELKKDAEEILKTLYEKNIIKGGVRQFGAKYIAR